MVIVSVVALLIFLVALLIAYLKANDTLMTTLLGIAGAGYTTVVGFWLGSSYGSSKKTDMLTAAAPSGGITPTTPSVIQTETVQSSTATPVVTPAPTPPPTPLPPPAPPLP
jgi:hypothetical protein